MREGDDLRKNISRGQHRQLVAWGAGLAGVLILYVFFSAGFFLYTAIVVVSLLGVSTAMAHIALLGVETDRLVGRKQISIGEEAEVVLTLHNDKNLPALWLSWEENLSPGMDHDGPSLGVRTLQRGEQHEVRYRLRPQRRGLFRIGPVRLEGSGPFGLVRRVVLEQSATFITVLPRIVPINPEWPLGHRPSLRTPHRRGLFDDPSRFIGVRQYRAGDSLQRIHWRASARRASLQTRVFEASVLQGCQLVVDAHSDHSSRLEISLTAAASILDYMLQAGHAVGLISNGADSADLFRADWDGTELMVPEGLAGPHASSLLASEGGSEPQGSSAAMAGMRQEVLSIPPGRGMWQRARLLEAIARLTVADRAGIGETLLAASPRLARDLVVVIVASVLDVGLIRAVHSLRQSGFELAVVYTSDARGRSAKAMLQLPKSVSVHLVADEQDLRWLGARAL